MPVGFAAEPSRLEVQDARSIHSLRLRDVGIRCAKCSNFSPCKSRAGGVPIDRVGRSSERDPSVKDVTLDFDGMTVAKANTKVEDTPIKTIVIGDAYLEKGKKDTRRTFLCLIGEKGKVLLTFFTDK
jgi:hypothetical protein